MLLELCGDVVDSQGSVVEGVAKAFKNFARDGW